MGFPDRKKSKQTTEKKCARCGRRIRRYEKYAVIDGKPYCEKCAQAKKDWDFLEFLAMIED